MATAKQIAARKLFAQRAKSGAFKRKATTARKTNPARKRATIKRKGVSRAEYVERPSQATRKTPTKRLVARRKAAPAVKRNAPKGYFPNPGKFLYNVGPANADGDMRYHVAVFRELAKAKEYAQAYADKYKLKVAIAKKPI